MAQEYGFCLADELNFNTLIPNRAQGAIFDLVGSFGINIKGDPHCVPLSLEGLSKAHLATLTEYAVCE
jgi:hypothetical protein